MTVREYRQKHKRCRTCKPIQFRGGALPVCRAKNLALIDVVFYVNGIKGMFCPIYEPKEEE